MSVEQLARYEFKYTLGPEAVQRAERLVRLHCQLDRTGVCDEHGAYTVDSLYFDTPRFQFFRDAEDMRANRLKLRVRTYPDTPASIVKIEVKRRIQDLVVKTSTLVPGGSWVGWLHPGSDLSGLPEPSRRALEVFCGLQRGLDAAPKMLVRYSRRAYHSTIDDYVRVTFDSRMLYQPMYRYELLGNPHRWGHIDDAASIGVSGGLLMEIKFRVRPPLWIADFIRGLGLARQGFSKYGTAMRHCTMTRRALWDLAPSIPASRAEEPRWIF